MGDAAVDQNQLEQIGTYVKGHIALWMREQNIYPIEQAERGMDKEIFERMVTVEQQLKFQNEKLELMMKQSDERFEQIQNNMDARFEQVQNNMDTRFEAVDKRFNHLYTFLTGIFLTMLAGFIPLVIKSF